MRRGIALARRRPITTAACSLHFARFPRLTSVAAVTALPMSTIGSDFTRPYWPEHARPEGKACSEASIRMATPGYFGTLGLPLMAGREFTDRDDADAPRVVIVNQKLARNAWGNENPVGRNLILDYQRGPIPMKWLAWCVTPVTTGREASRCLRFSFRTRRTRTSS